MTLSSSSIKLNLILLLFIFALQIVAPVFAYWFYKQEYKKRFVQGLLVGCVISITSALVVTISKWSLSGITADVIIIALAYLSYWILLCLSPRLSDQWLRKITFSLGIILPIIGCMLSFYLSMFGGFFNRFPLEQGALQDRYIYRIRVLDHWGCRRIEVLKVTSFIPILEKEVFRREFHMGEAIEKAIDVDLLRPSVENRDGKTIVVIHLGNKEIDQATIDG
ncbi:MAG TPA: hypothetical protein VEF04_17710 [Blastocatellia bacterium]|nr:hypothetical protein [Blastocatellia bacterium]